MTFKTAEALNMSPPWNPPNWVWRLLLKYHKLLLPFLHKFDECATQDTCMNLFVLWWKAIAGNKRGSQFYDQHIAYDLLPSYSRLIVASPWCWLYPNLHHHVVAMRTKFLDQAILQEINRYQSDNDVINPIERINTKKYPPHIITLGGGFDTRALRMTDDIASWYEIDLPDVINQKSRLLKRYVQRRPCAYTPMLYTADLNEMNQLTIALNTIFDHIIHNSINQQMNLSSTKTIIILEAVLMYLKDDSVPLLLKCCADIARAHNSSLTIVFADLFPVDIPIISEIGAPEEREAVRLMINKQGFELETWLPKSGRTRHMGVARLR